MSSLLPWPRRKPLHVTIKYRGGPECWYEIRARGRTWRRPGVVCLHDLMAVIYADGMSATKTEDDWLSRNRGT